MKRFATAALFVFLAVSARADTIVVGTLAKANDTVQISSPNMATVTFVVSGNFSATATPQVTLDGTTWQTATVTGPYPSTSTATSITSAGTYQFTAAAWAYFQLKATSYTSGTVNVTEYASAASSASGSGGGGAVTQSGTWTVQPGNTANTTAWLFNLTSSQLTTLTPPPNTGYSTAAKQPALGTAGTPSADVITVQGATGATPTIVQGPVADAAASSGNPVPSGGFYHSGADTYTNNQAVTNHYDSAGNLKTTRADRAGGESLNTYNNSPSGVNGAQGVTPFVPISTDFSPSTYQSSASGSQVVSANIKNTAGQIVGGRCLNANAAIRYLWITNATSAPAGALASSDATVVEIIGLPATSSTPLDIFTAAGKNCATGISFGFSTSSTSYTAGTASDCMLDVTYF